MHDAPKSHLPAVRKFLDSAFPEQWSEEGRDGPTAWPARSTHFSPMGLYIWGRVKSAVCAAEISDVQTAATNAECI